MVADWLRRYMLSGQPDAADQARRIADWFADYEGFRSHNRRVGLEQAAGLGLRVSELEQDDYLQDLVLSIHHAAMHTFSGTPANKIIENHLGRAWVRMRAGPENH